MYSPLVLFGNRNLNLFCYLCAAFQDEPSLGERQTSQTGWWQPSQKLNLSNVFINDHLLMILHSQDTTREG